MRKHTQDFKEKIKQMGRQLDSKITFGETTLGNEQLNAITPVLQSSLLKSVMKELDIDSNVEIPVGTVLNYKLGVLIDDENYEYLDFGNYQVYSIEKQEDNNAYNIVAYDKMLNSMVDYTNLKSTISQGKVFPMTVRDYLMCLCADLKINFKNKEDEFANYDKIIESDLYAGLGYTYRDILDELAQVTASNIIINENDELEIRYITDTNDTIDEEFLKDINVKFGEKYGPINSIVLSRSSSADNVYLQDEQSVADNGLHELKIEDNQIMNFNDRSNYLPAILEKLDNLEFYINDFTSTGICYYEIADKYNITVGENTYPCVMLNDEIDITQGLEEAIFTELPEQAETDYTKADKTDRKINQTYLIVDKQNQKIESVVSQTDGFNERISKAEQTVEGFTQTVEDMQQIIDEGGFITNEELSSAITQSASQIESTVTSKVTKDIDDKLDSYPTTTEMNSAISQSASQIQSTVSRTYSTKTETTQAKNDAISSANTNTTNKLKDYSTTTQMNSAIKQSADSINQSVSQQITDAEGNILKNVNGQLDLYIKKKDTGEVVSAFNLNSNEVVINSDNFKLDAKGNTTMNSANITGGKININDQSVVGDNYNDPAIQVWNKDLQDRGLEHFVKINSTGIKVKSDSFMCDIEAITGFECEHENSGAQLTQGYVNIYDNSNGVLKRTSITDETIETGAIYIKNNPTASTHGVRLQDLNGTVVWTNSSPNQAYDNKTVSLDLSKYQTFKLMIKTHKDNSDYISIDILEKNKVFYATAEIFTTEDIIVRGSFSISNTGFQTIGRGYYRLLNFKEGISSTNVLIPYKLIAYI